MIPSGKIKVEMNEKASSQEEQKKVLPHTYLAEMLETVVFEDVRKMQTAVETKEYLKWWYADVGCMVNGRYGSYSS